MADKKEKRRMPWDVVSMLLGIITCAAAIIAIIHNDVNAMHQDYKDLGKKIDDNTTSMRAELTLFLVEMRDLHGRLSTVETKVDYLEDR